MSPDWRKTATRLGYSSCPSRLPHSPNWKRNRPTRRKIDCFFRREQVLQTNHSNRISEFDDYWYPPRWCLLAHWQPRPMVRWIVLRVHRTRRTSDDKSSFVASTKNCSNAMDPSSDGSSLDIRPSMPDYRPDRWRTLVHSDCQCHCSSSMNWTEPVEEPWLATVEMRWTITRTDAFPSDSTTRRNLSAWGSTRRDSCIYSCSSVANCTRACRFRLADDSLAMLIETICSDSTTEAAYSMIDDGDYDCDKNWSRAVQ